MAARPSSIRRVSDLLSGLLILAAIGTAACGGSSADVRLLDLDNHEVNIFGTGSARAVAFIFTRVDCPIANRYAPELQRLHDRYAERGIEVALVYVERDLSADAIRQHLAEYGYRLRALRDPGHALVAATGATVTPEAAVFVIENGRGRLVYRGRIDDRYEAVGRSRPVAMRHDFDAVLAAIASGTVPSATTTRASGCLISDVR